MLTFIRYEISIGGDWGNRFQKRAMPLKPTTHSTPPPLHLQPRCWNVSLRSPKAKWKPIPHEWEPFLAVPCFMNYCWKNTRKASGHFKKKFLSLLYKKHALVSHCQINSSKNVIVLSTIYVAKFFCSISKHILPLE